MLFISGGEFSVCSYWQCKLLYCIYIPICVHKCHDVMRRYSSFIVALFQVLQHVRLPLMTPKFLVGTVGADLLIKSDEACRDLVDEAKNYLLLPQERPLMQGPRTRPRKPIKCGEVLFAGKMVNSFKVILVYQGSTRLAFSV